MQFQCVKYGLLESGRINETTLAEYLFVHCTGRATFIINFLMKLSTSVLHRFTTLPIVNLTLKTNQLL